MYKLNQFLESVKLNNPGETEFLQAVTEFATSVIDFVNKNPAYEQAKILERIVEPERNISFRVTWTNDKGEVQVNRGYRIEFNSAIGPYKGGLRFHPTVNSSILKFLGFEQIFKNSLTGLPMGGGKGGSDFDPHEKTDSEVMKFCQAFMSELYRHIGPNTDVPAGDIGVGGREIGYLFGQYKKLKNEFSGVLTGKGFNWGGSLIRPEATGFGLVYFVNEMLKNQKDSLKGKNVLISGSGNVAQFAAQKVIELGGKLLTMSDSDGTVYDKDGITQEKLQFIMDLKNKQRGRIKDYADKYHTEYLDGKKPWSLKADIALPCATQNEIELEDAKELVSSGVILVGEGANMPLSNDAIDYLHSEKVLHSPGKASNAGGVAVSGLEMSQNSLRLQWSRDELDERLQNIMKDIHHKCVEYGTENGYVNYVKGANIAGFKKVADAMLDQGIV
ncbi:MAG: Glutamate dehydrogenase [Candidatus Shapirobacteria bacterium GW2011_GWE1_38_10]|uniref:Glutamate dehydrogenase n=1 Tax=Candidatus Shapirobacteria bacterium GW2011_GWE1_38_10 TaxID=1618488 RepID=A0A0G0IDJ6_9BACT|nr:MAG: Glutamate dehydrogenase [Candidatus Shapirobacteria bacterium GW2011_GWF2_37_20]KKQ49060.1 MAG: Glutamate dehydrogenase [Candidatus Shapirobacteria bacterium GW2011_GWE1_38_10]HBP51179.1 NADP-specific glutamate dehydrogenase [Candidatus Shapirobacteria bacterium]